MLHLEKVTSDNLVRLQDGLVEMEQNPTPFDIAAVQKMLAYWKTGFDGYLAELARGEGKIQPDGQSPDTVLLLFNDNKFIGVYDVRHVLTPYLLQTGGNIAYQIIPSERQKGYVKAGLKLVLDWCRLELGLDKVLLFCKQENIPSYKAMSTVMMEMGGICLPDKLFEGHMKKGVWIYTHKEGTAISR